MSLIPVSPKNNNNNKNGKTTTTTNPRSLLVLQQQKQKREVITLRQQQQTENPRKDQILVSRALIESADNEHRSLEMTLRVAEELFTKLIIEGGASNNNNMMMMRSTNNNNSSQSQQPDVFDIGHTRIAISCFFLERLCAVFPRHNAAVRPLAEAIVRSIFVPDTEVTRELVGNLDSPIMIPNNNNNNNIPSEVIDLLRPYARKTYAAAFSKISSMLKRYSKTSHSLEIRLKRQAQVFERTLAHWRKTLLRSVFVAWRSTIRRRIFLRAKYRQIFSRLREDECRARAIRLWHQRATRLRKAALADAAMQQEMSKLKMTSESVQQQIVSLLEQNATLSRDVAELERQRQLLTQEMQDRDRFVLDMNHRTAEAERLGTELLNSVLMKHDPPQGTTPLESLVRWGHEVIDVHGSIDGMPNPLACLLSDEAVLTNFNFSAFGTILGAFEVEGAPPREAILQMHISPESAPALLVQYYGRVTQRPCIVSESHLKSKQRGVLLLFLASLMRFASSWMFGPPPLNLREKVANNKSTFEASNNQNQNQNQNQQQHGANSWMDRVRTQQRWVVVSLSAMNAALLIASDRPRILSVEEQEDEDKYCGALLLFNNNTNNNNTNLMEDLLPSSQIEDRLPHVVKAVRNVFPEIRKLYLTYSSPTMTIDELWKLLKDSKIVNASATGGGNSNNNSLDQLTKRKLQSMISLVKRLSYYAGLNNNNNNVSASENDTSSPPPDSPSSRNNNSNQNQNQQQQHNINNAHELTPLQFTIVLLHVSLFEHRRQMRLDNPESIMFEPFMLDNVIRSMREHALRTDVDQFRHVTRHPLVQAVIARHKIPLRRAFRKFANCDEGESMNRNAFHQMGRSCMWLSKTVTIDTLNDIFKRVQRAEDVAAGGAVVSLTHINTSAPSETIDLSEWIECICAIATFTFPNPFKPLWEKLGIFIEEKVIVALGV